MKSAGRSSGGSWSRSEARYFANSGAGIISRMGRISGSTRLKGSRTKRAPEQQRGTDHPGEGRTDFIRGAGVGKGHQLRDLPGTARQIAGLPLPGVWRVHAPANGDSQPVQQALGFSLLRWDDVRCGAGAARDRQAQGARRGFTSCGSFVRQRRPLADFDSDT